MAERAEHNRHSEVLVTVAAGFGLWCLVLVGFGLFGSRGSYLRERGSFLLELGFLAVPLSLFPLTLIADAKARYVAPLQLVSMGMVAVLAGEGASLLYRETGTLCVLDVPPVGYGIVVLIAILSAALRLLLRSGARNVPVAAWLVPWVLAAIPVARFVCYRSVDPRLVASVGLCALLGVLVFHAVRMLHEEGLRSFGVGGLLLAGGEAVALLVGPTGLLLVGLQDSYAWLARHLLVAAGLIVLCCAALRYSEVVHG